MAATEVKHLGCFITPKKKCQLNWDRFVELAREKNILVHDVDLSGPISLDVPLDLVITKFNIELNSIRGSNPDPKCIAYLKNYTDYIKAHPNLIEVDPIECQEKLTSRPKMLELFQEVAKRFTELHVPQSVVITSKDVLPPEFPFPAICKTLEATGSLTSHDMGIVYNESGLSDFPKPVLVQQFISHSATIFKIFAIGDYFYMVRRPSIRDLHRSTNDGNTILFNSQEYKALAGEPTAPFPPQGLIDSLVKFLSRDLGLSLIGLDIITCSSTGKQYIIDANYFPGYNGVQDCPIQILQLVLQKLKL